MQMVKMTVGVYDVETILRVIRAHDYYLISVHSIIKIDLLVNVMLIMNKLLIDAINRYFLFPKGLD